MHKKKYAAEKAKKSFILQIKSNQIKIIWSRKKTSGIPSDFQDAAFPKKPHVKMSSFVHIKMSPNSTLW